MSSPASWRRRSTPGSRSGRATGAATGTTAPTGCATRSRGTSGSASRASASCPGPAPRSCSSRSPAIRADTRPSPCGTAKAGCCTAATPTSTTGRSPRLAAARPVCAPSRASPRPTAASGSPTRNGCASSPPATAARSRSSAPTTPMTSTAPERLWTPPPELVEASRLVEYMRWLAAERGFSFGSYEELWKWSVDDLEGFWGSIWDFFGVSADGERTAALASSEMPGAEWFPGTSLNYAEHVFAGKDDAEVAILHASELRDLGELSWGELRARVAAVAADLRELGVGPGDRVVAYMPNIPEAIVAFLASASIGAVWSSCSPDFGPASVIDRFAQIEPKVLFAVDGYSYGGKRFDRREVLAELQEAMPTLERTVVLPYLDPDPDLSGLRDAIRWDGLAAGSEGAELTFERVPFEDPLWVLYSSGTTGLPKAIVQSQ